MDRIEFNLVHSYIFHSYILGRKLVKATFIVYRLIMTIINTYHNDNTSARSET